MRLVRIAVVNVNTTVGAVRSNVDRAIVLAREAAADGATLVAFGEQLIAGYSPEDLVQWRAFVDAQWRELERFAVETKDLAAVLAIGLTVARGSHLYNCAALVHRGKIIGVVPKEKLPTYNVFYEARVYARGVPGLQDEVHGVPVFDTVIRYVTVSPTTTFSGPSFLTLRAGGETLVFIPRPKSKLTRAWIVTSSSSAFGLYASSMVFVCSTGGAD